MQLRAFSLFDAKTGAFAPPFFLHHVGAAIRAVSELGQDRNTTVGRHPSDFVLYEIGMFDDATGALVASVPHSHGVVASFLPQQQPLPLDGAFPAVAQLERELHGASNGAVKEG